jgi:hypothetical protein
VPYARALAQARSAQCCQLCHHIVELLLQLQTQPLLLLTTAQRVRGLARHPGDDDVFYLFLQKQKIGAELHIYLEEGTYHKRLFRGPNTNDMKKPAAPHAPHATLMLLLLLLEELLPWCVSLRDDYVVLHCVYLPFAAGLCLRRRLRAMHSVMVCLFGVKTFFGLVWLLVILSFSNLILT